MNKPTPGTGNNPEQPTAGASLPGEQGANAPQDTDTGQQSPEPQNGSQEDLEQGKAGNKEAAKYRVKLRELEADHAALQSQLDGAVDQLASAALGANSITPQVLRKFGHNLNSLIDESGNMDTRKLQEAQTDVMNQLGIQPHRPVPASGTGSGALSGPSWADALRRNR